MLNYVALLRVDTPSSWGQWHSWPTERYYKSPISTDKSEAETWLTNELSKYPDACINAYIPGKEYLIYTTIIAFDVEESNNVEMFLNKSILH